MNPAQKQLVILTLFSLAIITPSKTPAQNLATASWSCGRYSQDFLPFNLGNAISDHYDGSFQNIQGSFTDIWDAHLVFSLKGFTYDGNGNVIGTETIVRPSASVLAQSSWTGPAGQQGGDGTDSGAGVVYYGRINAKPGAPAGVLVPLRVRLRGYANAFNSFYGFQNSSARALSGFTSPGGELYGQAYAGRNQPYAEYDKSLSVSNYAGVGFSAFASAQAHAYIEMGNVSGSSTGTAEAFADPSIDIDPSYVFKSFFSLEFSTNILFTPADPGPRLSLTSGLGGITTVHLVGVTNHVYELQASTNFFSQSWQVIAVVTNVDGTVNYTDTGTTNNEQRIYRARVVKILQ